MTATSSRSGTRRRRKKKSTPRPPLGAGAPPLPPNPSGAGASSSSAADLGAAADELAREHRPEAELEEAAQILDQHAAAAARAEQEAPPAPPTPGAPAPSGPDPAQLGARIHMVVFTLLAARLGPHWELSQEEQQLAGETVAPLLAALMARVTGLAINLTMYGMVLMSLVVPRLQQDAKLERENANKEKEPERGTDQREDQRGHGH